MDGRGSVRLNGLDETELSPGCDDGEGDERKVTEVAALDQYCCFYQTRHSHVSNLDDGGGQSGDDDANESIEYHGANGDVAVHKRDQFKTVQGQTEGSLGEKLWERSH